MPKRMKIKVWMILSSLMLIWGVLAGEAGSTTVLYVAMNGSDTEGNGSMFAPYRTIQKAIDSAFASEENPALIVVAPGRYRQCLLLKSYVSLLGYGPSRTTIEGSSQGSAIKGVNVRDIYIDGFSITGGAGVYGGGICLENAQNVLIRNNHIVGNRASICGAGIAVISGSRVRINNNLIMFNYCQETTSAGGGIYLEMLSGGTDQSQIIPSVNNNTIIWNFAPRGAGIFTNRVYSVIISNNILQDNLDDGIFALPTTALPLIYNNNSYRNGRGFDYSQSLSEQVNDPRKGNISAEQIFESGPMGDFYLKEGSVGIDSGYYDFKGSQELPLFGTSSLNGSPDAFPVDMGYRYRDSFYFFSADRRFIYICGYPAKDNNGLIQNGSLYLIWKPDFSPYLLLEGPIPIDDKNMQRTVLDGVEYYQYPKAISSNNLFLKIYFVWMEISPRTGVIDPSKGLNQKSSPLSSVIQFFEPYISPFINISANPSVLLPSLERDFVKEEVIKGKDKGGSGYTGSLRGKVRDQLSGLPIRNAAVHAGMKYDFTDENGDYEILNLPARTISVDVFAAGYLPQRREVNIPPGQTAILDFWLIPDNQPYGAIKGYIRDKSSGNPVASAYIKIGWYQTISNSQGYYFLGNIQPGLYLVEVFAEGYQRATAQANIYPSQETTLDFELTAEGTGETGTLKGKITNILNGAPIQAAIIYADKEDGCPSSRDEEHYQAISDMFGNYLIPQMRPGIYFVRVVAQGYCPAFKEATITSDQTETVDFQLYPMPRETGSIIGTVLDAENSNPIPGALVILVPFISPPLPAFVGVEPMMSILVEKTDEQGRFFIADIPAINYWVLIWQSGYRPLFDQVQIMPDQIVDRLFMMEKLNWPLPLLREMAETFNHSPSKSVKILKRKE